MNLLTTDGYKFSMAEAGWPLRIETFYYTHRRGGPAIVPFDVHAEIDRILPRATHEDYVHLAQSGYEMGAGFKAAIATAEGALSDSRTRQKALTVHALPRGTWFLPREPVFSVTGPSALVSWLEPLALQLHYRIQIASLARTNPEALPAAIDTVTCDAEREIVLATLDAVGVRAPKIIADPEGYFQRVKAAADELIAIVDDPSRLFEVGLRAATCVNQHLIALEACKAAGLRKTSHVFGARKLGMTSVGTMGHEHVQRFGSDEAAFRAMRDRRPGPVSYLLDTFDTINSGIPAAYRAIEEDKRADASSIRYDSGDKEAQYRFAIAEAKRRGIRPTQILEDGFDAALTRRFEALRKEVGWAPQSQLYGYGGHLIATPSFTSLTRDHVAAVYKLSETAGSPTMKFGNEAREQKQSLPGQPIVFRRIAGSGPVALVGQLGEQPPAGYIQLTDALGDIDAINAPVDAQRTLLEGDARDGDVQPSDATRALVTTLRATYASILGGLSEKNDQAHRLHPSPKPGLAIAGGSVPGRPHVLAGRNNQDAFAWSCTASGLIAVVCDGCGSASHSEVGAKLGARLIIQGVAARLGTGMETSSLLNSVRGEVVAHLHRMATAMSVERDPYVEDSRLGEATQYAKTVIDHFLFTVVGVLVDGGIATTFSLGDGLVVVNGVCHRIDPSRNNEPAYLGYDLLHRKDLSRAFTIHTTTPLDELDTVLLGTDGAFEIEEIGALRQFWTDERFLRNPDQIRRSLTLICRDRPSDGLSDDATLVVLRRAKGARS